MSANGKFLIKHGWTAVSRKRQGAFLIVKWYKLGQGTMNQEMALIMQRAENKYAKALAEMNDSATQLLQQMEAVSREAEVMLAGTAQ